ncbi:hypothetical protein VM1G_11449 [Cytospora mali]|uniref:Uncharacterized protein n=1 Tax=Cytospora mali TaxID=578113 RepID=A0A194VRC4_CYTMA|nr:hypothetical protein VM1G_11449 [Valsa mali]
MIPAAAPPPCAAALLPELFRRAGGLADRAGTLVGGEAVESVHIAKDFKILSAPEINVGISSRILTAGASTDYGDDDPRQG